jgi:hypothetical protein
MTFIPSIAVEGAAGLSGTYAAKITTFSENPE